MHACTPIHICMEEGILTVPSFRFRERREKGGGERLKFETSKS